jgi:hypothetical protein
MKKMIVLTGVALTLAPGVGGAASPKEAQAHAVGVP